MNDRLRELMLAAGYAAPELADRAHVLADLIVRECAEVAGCNGHVSGFAFGDLIKQHFGVKD
jgi:hypothetical protein